tara:strand:- start:53557 stop:53892 length:336 start_codon:yes stop_codon:yes gene_type:complete
VSKNERKLVINEFVVMDGKLIPAICKVEIYEDSEAKKREVILSNPNLRTYRGVSTTNNFENFSTKIKSIYLSSVDEEEISWFDHMGEDLVVPVKMKNDGGRYIEPTWGNAL